MPSSLNRRSARYGRVLAAALTLAAVGLAPLGCDSSGGYRTPAERAAAAPIDHDAYATLGYRLEWRGFAAIDRGARVRFVEPMGDIISVMDTGGLVSVIEAQTGRTRWSEALGGSLTKFVGLNRDQSRLIVSSETDVFYLDLTTRTLLDRARLARVVNTRPASVGPILVYGTTSGEIIGHLTTTNFRAWGNSLRGAIDAEPLAVGNRVAVVSFNGDVAILDGFSGASIGRNTVAGAVEAPLAASESMLYVASLDQSLYAFDLDSGSQVWRRRTERPLRDRPVYHDGRVYCTLPGMGLAALDASSGQQAWAAQDVGGHVVAVRRGRLVVWNAGTGEAVTVDPANGQVLDRVRLPNVAVLRADQFDDGAIYAVSEGGVVSRFAPR